MIRLPGEETGNIQSMIKPSHENGGPKVSIGIPVYKGENFLENAIRSILAQTYQDWELIISDNDSPDNTGAIARKYSEQDKRIRYSRNPKNLGANANYNRCLELARGEYFKWMAHDDWISPRYIEKCVEVLDNQPDAGLAFGMPKEMLDEERPYLNSDFSVPDWGDAGPVERFALAMRMPRTCHAIFGLYRRELLERTTLHRPYYTSDRNLVAETALLGRFVAVPDVTFYNRRHEKQSMAQSANRIYLNTWGDTSNTKPYSTQNLSRLRHFLEICGRYPDIASRRTLFLSSAGFFFSPKKLLRYLDEACQFCSPRAYGIARRQMVKLFRLFKRPDSYIKT